MNNELKMGIEDLATLLTSKLEDRHPTLPDHSFSTTVGRNTRSTWRCLGFCCNDYRR